MSDITSSLTEQEAIAERDYAAAREEFKNAEANLNTAMNARAIAWRKFARATVARSKRIIERNRAAIAKRDAK